MATHLTRIRFIIGALTLAFIVACAAPVKAQQRNPDNSVNPTASAVNESQLLNELDRISGRCTIPDQKACTLEQPAGRDWRHFHQVTLRWIGAISILGMLVLLVVFYLTRGMVRLEAGRSGRVLVRFSAFERLVHWMTASCFIILALSGLNITFGRPLLLPLIGPEAFTAWSQWAKYAHNYLSFPFTLGVFLIFMMWIAWPSWRSSTCTPTCTTGAAPPSWVCPGRARDRKSATCAFCMKKWSARCAACSASARST